MASNGSPLRYSRKSRCPICRGYDDRRLRGDRCFGYLSADRTFAYCVNVQGKSNETYGDSQAYPHWLKGLCACGQDHRNTDIPDSKEEGGGLRTSHYQGYDYRHDYLDSNGGYLFSVLRWDRNGTKDIRQGVETQEGWLRLADGGVERPYPLYHLPRLKSLATRSTVIVVEGEKCADTLSDHIDASKSVIVTSMGGEKNAHNTDWSPVSGHAVVILPDNDKAGSSYAQSVTGLCHAAGAASIRVVNLPGLPEKGDIVDWLRDGHTIEELRALVAMTPPEKRLAVLADYRKQDDEDVYEWEDPIDLGTWTNLEHFPAEVLPEWARRMVLEVRRNTQTPVDLAALVFLSVLSTTLGGKVTVWAWSGKKDEPVTLYVMVAMPPGSRKSPVFKYMTAPIYIWEEREIERLGTEQVEAQAHHDTLEVSLKLAQEKAAKLMPGDPDRDRAYRNVSEIQKELAELVIPRAPQMIADESTSEALVRLFKSNGGRIALLSDEGDLLDIIAGRYSGEPRLGPYKKGYDGGQIRVNRVARTEIVKRPALTIGVTPQPDVLMGLGKVKRLTGEGLLDRFIFSLPEDLRGERDNDQPPVPDEVIVEYEKHILALCDVAAPVSDDGSCAAVIRFSEEAAALFVRFENEMVERGFLNPERYGHIPGWAGKFPAKVARIAALLHCAELIETQSRPWETPISLRTLKKAMAIGRYIASHAVAAFDLMKQDAIMEDAQKLLNWLRDYVAETGERRFTHRAAWHPFRGKFKKPDDFTKVFEALTTNGFLRQLSQEEIDDWYEEKGGRGRKPESASEINPLWIEKTIHKASKKQASWDEFTNYDEDDEPLVVDTVMESKASVELGEFIPF